MKVGPVVLLLLGAVSSFSPELWWLTIALFASAFLIMFSSEKS